MILVQGRGCFYRKCPSVALLDFFSLPELGEKLFNQPSRLPGPHFAIVPTATFLVPKYTKEDLQQILQTVLKA